MTWLDKLAESVSRVAARRLSRRGMLAGVGAVIAGGVGASVLLPVSRRADAATLDADPGDPNACDYWRYCAIDGYLCSCCGGTHTACPPGTVMSPITWIGTCRNPGDGKDYIISYNDCCGRSGCGQCGCMRNEGDRPAYQPSSSNNLNWCTGSGVDIVYNCSTAIILGVDDGS